MDERRKEYPSILEKLGNLEDKIEKVFKILNGNGEMGIVAKVLSMETYIKSLKNSKSKVVDYVWKFSSGGILMWIAYRLGMK